MARKVVPAAEAGGVDEAVARAARRYAESLEATDREACGRAVREEWVSWAAQQPDVGRHPSWLKPWEELEGRDREVDRRIGERLFRMGFSSGVAAADSKLAAMARRLELAERAVASLGAGSLDEVIARVPSAETGGA